MKKTLSASSEYPVFWWNFVILEKGVNTGICQALKKQRPEFLSRVECDFSLDDEKDLLKSWEEDVFLRLPFPGSASLARQMDQGLSQASLPGLSSSMGGLIENLRMDPLGQMKVLAKQAENKLKIPFSRRDGFFQDEATERIIIPIQMNYPPMETVKTRGLYEALKEFEFAIIGPHASSFSNQDRVMEDSKMLSMVSMAVVACFITIMTYYKKWSLILLLPPVLLGGSFAALGTILVFGSVHVITLAFGVGLIGLAFDYGVHGAFGVGQPGVWKSNLYGYLTTVIGFIVLAFSDIPLIRQMMVFSIFGLTASYLIYFFLITRFPNLFRTEPYGYNPKTSPLKLFVTVCLLVCCFVGMFTLKPRLDMAAFDYRPPQFTSLAAWLFRSMNIEPPLFRVVEGNTALEESSRALEFSKEHGILIETMATYLPSEAIQKANLETWQAACPMRVSQTHSTFYKPFLEITPCVKPYGPLTGVTAKERSYLKGLNSNGKWLTMWFPKTEAQASDIRNTYADATSLKEMADTFPKILSREAAWMGWVSMGLASLFLLFNTRSFYYALLSIVPFLTGTGLVVLTSMVFHIDISFISLVGFIMLFGISLDYGIFVTDMLRVHYEGKDRAVLSALLHCAGSTLAGLFPLLFCKHPILLHLGHTLFFGALGVFLGAVWGIPGFFKLRAGLKL